MFSTPSLLLKKGSSGAVTHWRQLVSCDWLWHSHGSLIQSRFDLKINRAMKTPWQEYSCMHLLLGSCSYWNVLILQQTEYPGPKVFSWFFPVWESLEAANASREAPRKKNSGYLGLESHFYADARVRESAFCRGSICGWQIESLAWRSRDFQNIWYVIPFLCNLQFL